MEYVHVRSIYEKNRNKCFVICAEKTVFMMKLTIIYLGNGLANKYPLATTYTQCILHVSRGNVVGEIKFKNDIDIVSNQLAA